MVQLYIPFLFSLKIKSNQLACERVFLLLFFFFFFFFVLLFVCLLLFFCTLLLLLNGSLSIIDIYIMESEQIKYIEKETEKQDSVTPGHRTVQ